MELYLRWLDRHKRQPDEDTPLGIILCAGKQHEQIELLELNKSGIHVADHARPVADMASLVAPPTKKSPTPRRCETHPTRVKFSHRGAIAHDEKFARTSA
jgi:hypothetical protein